MNNPKKKGNKILKYIKPLGRFMSYEGENKWVPMEKFEELDKIIHCVTEEFWDKYFNESK